MAEFPAKLMLILNVLDEDSSCVVILNNITGLESEEKTALRSMLELKNSLLIDSLLQFRVHQKPDVLITTLKSLAQSKKVQCESKKIDIMENTLSFKVQPADIKNSLCEDIKKTFNTSEKASQKECVNTDNPPTDTVRYSNSRVLQEKSNDQQNLVTNNKCAFVNDSVIYKVDDPKQNVVSPSQMKTNMQKREQRLMKTDARFQLFLRESKDYIQDLPLCARSPNKQVLNLPYDSECETPKKVTHIPPKVQTPITKRESKEKIYNTPCVGHSPLHSDKKNTFQNEDPKFPSPDQNNSQVLHEGNSFGIPADFYLPDFNDSKCNAIPEIEAEGETTELTSTVQTEELFKKYITEMRKESSNVSNLLSISCNTFLRYIDCDILFSSLVSAADMDTRQLSKSKFSNVISNIIWTKLGKEPDIARINSLYDKLNEEGKTSMKIEEILGGLSIFCAKGRSNKLLNVLRFLNGSSGGSITRACLQSFLHSVFRVLINADPNAAKSAHTNASELSQLTTSQFYEDMNYRESDPIKPNEFVKWFDSKRLFLAPEKTQLNESICEDTDCGQQSYPCPIYYPMMPMPPSQNDYMQQIMYSQWMTGAPMQYGIAPQYCYNSQPGIYMADNSQKANIKEYNSLPKSRNYTGKSNTVASNRTKELAYSKNFGKPSYI